MDVRFLAGPFADGLPALGDAMLRHLDDPRLNKLDIVVAWAKRSGLSRVRLGLEAFRARGGTVSAIVGIDERGATKQGLALVRALCNEMWIYRDTSGGTFHPKVYVFRGPELAIAIIGSANLTRGGLWDNYELSTELSLTLPTESAVLREVDSWIDRLRAQTEACLEASDLLLANVSGSRLVQDEDRQEAWGEGDNTLHAVILPFGSAGLRKVRAPAIAGHDRAVRRRSNAKRGVEAGPATLPRYRILTRWFKKLDASSAQRPPKGGTNVTGVLRLTKSVFPIDQTTYFRNELFNKASWKQTLVRRRPAELAVVAAELRIDGRYLGRHRFQLTYAKHREAGQRNVTTVLHWGDAVGAILRGESRVGWWVVIEALSDGSFGLAIQRLRPDTLRPSARP